MPHNAVIELDEQLSDCLIQIFEVIKSVVSQHRQDPSLCHEYRRLDFSLVAGFSDPSCDDASAVVLGELPVRGVDLGLVAIRRLDRRAQIIRYRNRAGP